MTQSGHVACPAMLRHVPSAIIHCWLNCLSRHFNRNWITRQGTTIGRLETGEYVNYWCDGKVYPEVWREAMA